MKKHKNIVVINIVISSLLVVIPCVFDELYFFAADDYLMNLIIKGSYGSQPDPFLVYNNTLLGVILKECYLICPEINWYAIFQLATIVLVFIIINSSLIKLSDKLFEVFIVTGMLEVIVVYHLTFTIISYLCVGGACVFIFCEEFCADDKKSKIGTAVTFSLLILLSEAWRKNVFKTALIIFLILLIYIVIQNKKVLVYFIIAGSMVLIIKFADECFYSADSPMWEDYKSYNALRGQLIDFPQADYKTYQQEYDKIGLSFNDVQCFYRWIFADKSTFSESTLKEFINMQSIGKRYNFNIVEIIISMFHLKYNYWLLGVLILSLLQTGKGKLVNIGGALCTYGMVAALFFRNRVVLRVLIPLYILGCLVLIVWTWSHRRRKPKYLYNKIGVIYTVLALFLLFCITKENKELKELQRIECQKYTDVKNYIADNPEYLYIGSSGVVNPLEYSADIFSVGEDIDAGRVMKLGSWDLYSRRYYNQISNYNIENEESLLMALTEENVIYMVNDDEEFKLILRYLEEHLNSEIEYEEVKKCSASNVRMVSLIMKDE